MPVIPGVPLQLIVTVSTAGVKIEQVIGPALTNLSTTTVLPESKDYSGAIGALQNSIFDFII